MSLATFPQTAKCTCSTSRGHGRTGWSLEGNYLIEDHVGDVLRILTETTGPAVIVGWSVGAITGLLAAGIEPGHVKGALLADQTPFSAESADRYINVPVAAAAMRVAELVRELPDHDIDWAVGELGEVVLAGSKMKDISPPGYLHRHMTEAATMDPDVLLSQLSKPLSYNIEDLLGNVACPVRLVCGAAELGSNVIDSDVRRMRALCADFEVRNEPRAGHAVHRGEGAARFGQDIKDLLALVP